MRVGVTSLHVGRPLDLAVVIEQGAIPRTSLPTASVPGGIGPDSSMETEVISRWPDGSAALVGVTITNAPAGMYDVEVVAGAGHVHTERFLPDLKGLRSRLGCYVTVIDALGAEWRCEISDQQGFEAAIAIASGNGPSLRREAAWILPLNGLAGPHPRLTVEARVTLFHESDAMRIELSLENTRTDAGPPLAVPLNSVAFGETQLGSQTELWSTSAVTLHAGMRAPFVIDLTAGAIVAPDLASWARLGLAPPLDPSVAVTEAQAATRYNQLLGSAGRAPKTQLTDESGAPFSNWPVWHDMGDTGARDDIGWWPEWALMFLNGGSTWAEQLCRHADLAGSAAFSVHWRDGDAETLGLTYGHAWWKNAASAYVDDPKKKNPLEANIAHLPHLGALTWLTRRRAFAMDELASWAACSVRDNYPNNGTLQNVGQRREAWAMRTIAVAATFLPDWHPLKGSFASCLDRTFSKWETWALNHPLGSLGHGVFGSSGRATSFFTKYESAWMGAWFTAMAMAIERLRGADPGLARIVDHNWAWWRLYVTGPGTTWTAPDGEAIQFLADELVRYSVSVATYQPRWIVGAPGKPGKWGEVGGSHRDVSDAAALGWWARIFQDHKASPVTQSDLPADPDPDHALPDSGVFSRTTDNSAYHAYGPHLVSLHRLAEARGLPDAVAFVVELEKHARKQLNQQKRVPPAGVTTTIPIA